MKHQEHWSLDKSETIYKPTQKTHKLHKSFKTIYTCKLQLELLFFDFVHHPLSKEHNNLETGSVSSLDEGMRDTYSVGFIRKS